MLQVGRQKPLPVLFVVFVAEILEHVGGDGTIGAAGGRDPLDRAVGIKLAGQRCFHCCLPGAAGVEQRAIDVEQTDVHLGERPLLAVWGEVTP